MQKNVQSGLYIYCVYDIISSGTEIKSYLKYEPFYKKLVFLTVLIILFLFAFQGASCGYGVRRRVVECIRFDHLKVDKIHCLVVNVTFTVKRWIDPAWLVAAQEESVSLTLLFNCSMFIF